jgi:hypothetical protein
MLVVPPYSSASHALMLYFVIELPFFSQIEFFHFNESFIDFHLSLLRWSLAN